MNTIKPPALRIGRSPLLNRDISPLGLNLTRMPGRALLVAACLVIPCTVATPR